MTIKVPVKFLADVRETIDSSGSIEELNEYLRNKTGIVDFFSLPCELKEFGKFLDSHYNNMENDKELGDFQTPLHLTDKICRYIDDIGFNPETIIEPTCGEGNFAISSIRFFPGLKYAYCIDMQARYEWLFKLNILRELFEQDKNITIEFHRDNIFTHQISDGFRNYLDNHGKNLLILGNPPWVTNTELSILNSKNLPSKSNIKRSRGIDAITGKGNFDIAEYIILQMIQRFNGKLAMLCKTSVIRNIVKSIHRLDLKISNIQELVIDTKKEFDINVDAALFMADLNSKGSKFCTVSSLYEPNHSTKKYGWSGNKFVSDMELYKGHEYIDGKSPFIWRQGVKHDASMIMILKTNNNSELINGFQELVDIEDALLYPLIRGSEIKEPFIKDTINKVIVTQTSLNDDTEYIRLKYPETWAYLTSHSEHLAKRKSVVYKGKPKFSMFGIGDYAFKPYKVAISGFCKKPVFSLILPIDKKPVMLDDTCYYLSYDDFKDAFFPWVLLSSEDVKNFLSSIVFLDSKRPYTKEILMRIDIDRLLDNISYDKICNIYHNMLENYMEYEPNEEDFADFIDSLKRTDKQLTFDTVS